MSTRPEKPAGPEVDEASALALLEPLRQALRDSVESRRELESRVTEALNRVEVTMAEAVAEAVQKMQSSPPAAAAPAPPPPLPSPPPRSAEAGNLRSQLLTLHGAFAEIDRITESDKVLKKLWALAATMPLRLLLLEIRGRALRAESAHGFANFEGEKSTRLKKVIVPFDPDGIFMAASTEKAVYSGPRPSRGFPVDLTLVLGKSTPLWTLVVPFPHRSRWGRFLYVEADAAGLDDILLMEAVARCAVSQMRAGQVQPHRPADKLRAFKDATIRERKRRAERARKRKPPAKEPEAEKAEEAAPPSSEEQRQEALQKLRPPEDALDAKGRVRRPLRPAEILDRLGDLPPMPHISSSLLSLLEDPDTSLSEVAELVGQDPALAGRLLSVANSSFYGATRDCDSLPEAVVRLGFATIRSWVLAKVTKEVMLGTPASPVLMELWEQSMRAAMAAQLTAELVGNVDPDSAFIAGMMHNLGLLLLARNHPVAYEELASRVGEDGDFGLVERELLGFDHAVSGSLLMKKWGLGRELVRAVASHHEVGQTRSSLPAVVALAEYLVGPVVEDVDQGLHPAAAALGLDVAGLTQLREALAGRSKDPALFD